MTPTRFSPLVLIAIATTILAWASAFIVIRFAAPYFSGGALALGRLVIGVLLLGVVVLLSRRWVAPTRREWALIAGFGVLWFGLYNVALNIAEHSIDAGTTAMIVNIGPILIALGAGIFLGEGIPRWLAVGAGVAFLGVVLIGIGTSTGFGDGIGVLWALLSAVTYAIGVLLQKPALKRLPAAQVTWMGATFGMIACLPFAGNLVTELQVAPSSAILGMVYLGVVPTAIAFSTWAYALSRVPAGQLGISTYIVPPIAILLGALVFAELPAVLAIIGGALCLAGVALSRIRPRRVVTAPPASVATGVAGINGS